MTRITYFAFSFQRSTLSTDPTKRLLQRMQAFWTTCSVMHMKKTVFNQHSSDHQDFDVQLNYPIDDIALLQPSSSNPTVEFFNPTVVQLTCFSRLFLKLLSKESLG